MYTCIVAYMYMHIYTYMHSYIATVIHTHTNRHTQTHTDSFGSHRLFRVSSILALSSNELNAKYRLFLTAAFN